LRIAKVLSTAGHPFVVAPVTIVLMGGPRSAAFGIVLIAVAVMLGVIAWRVAKGSWSDYDVSDREQRHGFYPIALAIVTACTLASWLLGLPLGFVRALVAVIAMLITGAILTRWTKVSLHMMIDAFCTAVVVIVNPLAAVILALLTLAVGWSRVVLRRHTFAQVALGAVIGATTGEIVTLVNR